MNKPKIITISGQARHGKNTTAEILKDKLIQNNRRVLIINYGDYLKYIAKQYYNWNGEKDEFGRTLLQTLGTEKVRSKNPDFWVNIVIQTIDVLRDDFDYILVADVRFPNEINRLKEEGYNVISIHIKRLDFENELTKEQKQHISEKALDDYKFDQYLESKNLFDLESEITTKILHQMDGGYDS